jgi:hypothetical protein
MNEQSAIESCGYVSVSGVISIWSNVQWKNVVGWDALWGCILISRDKEVKEEFGFLRDIGQQYMSGNI